MLRRVAALHPGIRPALVETREAYAQWGSGAGRASPAWGPVRLALAALPAGAGLTTQPDGQPRLVTPGAPPKPLLQGTQQALRSILHSALRRARQLRAACARSELTA
eukprot:11623399-Alexandrium_andersonii.AAC.1